MIIIEDLPVLPEDQGEATEPVTVVPISALSVEGSPRTSGENLEHVRLLAAVSAELPPIIVHFPSMRVVDGVHRLAAARLRGENRIAATFFYGDEYEAFVLAVRANSTHGLPLSLAERKAAADRIVRSRPDWSDRSIAAVAGISAKTVAEVRAGAGGGSSGAARIGRDGRTRPVNSEQGRRAAIELISKNPGLSLRQIAKAAGISPETARDVRNKLTRGDDPLAARRPAAKREREPEREWGLRGPEPVDRPLPVRPAPGTAVGSGRREGIRRLRSDPALNGSEAGRILLGLLTIHAVETGYGEKLGESVPPHWGDIVASLAFECGKIWDQFAEQVERDSETPSR
ncbi:streptomycin biosynthesis regulator [Actinocorallia longicatena]|uniref:ParB N-terminal domain-containing protein n=1 Tax=Actinocorallia longicatena TaxID=111803 RepID=A0ABP6QB38_9ACTN